ncbi:cytochrome c oxidase subunit 4 [Corynebacterium crudilactis]|uniref:Cytochrome c oxidase polypeptide 4 n=1 Tax=Corynebacterium crudilactis TaxID=1652495 RepID=A0A172QUR4_9CORY|nr:cytochrome c oxidase subunit 4 [Corynebacterium crudilactis]ANE04434.1 cytochrome-c oxidase [Corynebacterium crudilactis]
MKSSAKLMYGLTVFMVAVAVTYIFATMHVDDKGSVPGVEWVGSVALVLSAGLTLMLGVYLHFTEVRADVLPEDWEEAEVADKAGTLGFFSPNSIWPAAMSGAVGFLAFGLVYFHYWMIAVGVLLLIFTVTKLNLQYGVPKEKH